MNNNQVTSYLDHAGVQYVVKSHSAPALTCETAAEQRGVRVSQIVKCMIGRDDKGGIYVMLLPGDKTLKLKKVRHHLGGKPINLVPPEDLVREYGLTVGAISPIQFIGKARIIMDPQVMAEEFVDISSGDPLSGIELASKDLKNVTEAQEFDIVSSSR